MPWSSAQAAGVQTEGDVLLYAQIGVMVDAGKP
jgi:hypothetical protein